MPFAYYDRLSPARQAIYRKSDAIGALKLPKSARIAEPVRNLQAALARGDRAAVLQSAQRLVDELVRAFDVPPVVVRVLAVRPTDVEGELHGLYEPDEDLPVARISVWMRTAQRRQIVAFRSFLRTVVHEFVHHLDYEHFLLPETFHTEGFYKREASLSNALLATVGIMPSERARGGHNGRNRLI